MLNAPTKPVHCDACDHDVDPDDCRPADDAGRECHAAYAARVGEFISTEWNPRYLAYCLVERRMPEAQLARDRGRWPGGVMCGFVLWVNERWCAWFAEIGYRPKILSDEYHKAFDAWLWS